VAGWLKADGSFGWLLLSGDARLPNHNSTIPAIFKEQHCQRLPVDTIAGTRFTRRAAASGRRLVRTRSGTVTVTEGEFPSLPAIDLLRFGISRAPITGRLVRGGGEFSPPPVARWKQVTR